MPDVFAYKQRQSRISQVKKLSSVYTPAFITVVALYNPEHKCKETILSTFRESGRRLVSISYLILFYFFLLKMETQSLVVPSVCNGIYDATTGAV